MCMSEAYHCYRWKIGASSLSDGGITSLSHCSVEGSASSSRDLKPFLEDAMVLYLTDKTSASTTNPANNVLAISENATCNGCAWK